MYMSTCQFYIEDYLTRAQPLISSCLNCPTRALPRDEIYSRARKVLMSIHDPLEGRYDNDDGECNYAVICFQQSGRRRARAWLEKNKVNSLMLLPVTGSPGGNTNSTVVRAMYDNEMQSAVQPSQVGNFHFLFGRTFRPRMKFTPIGIA